MQVRTYRRLAIVATAGIAVLVVAGGVVRLTGSGLGCTDYPRCNATRFVDLTSGHTAIEQLNRILSALVGIPTLALAVGSFFVRRRGLRWPAVGLFVTVLGNGLVGGVAVEGDLHPALVQTHFLLAMLSVVFGLVAVRRSGVDPIGSERPEGSTVALAVVTFAALVTGTVVTGTGPHAGDEDARRFGFDIADVARIHSITVLVAIALGLVVAYRARNRDVVPADLVSTWMFVALLQGAIGYVQYFNGVPELLVGVHLAGATALWAVTVWLALRSSDPARRAAPDVPARRDDRRTARETFAGQGT